MVLGLEMRNGWRCRKLFGLLLLYCMRRRLCIGMRDKESCGFRKARLKERVEISLEMEGKEKWEKRMITQGLSREVGASVRDLKGLLRPTQIADPIIE